MDIGVSSSERKPVATVTVGSVAISIYAAPVTVATGFLSLDETPMSIASFMDFWCRRVGKVFQVRAGGKEKARR